MSETLSDRASTRVHAPPGGASSMASILGGGAPEAPVARPAPSAPQFVPTTNNAVAAGSATVLVAIGVLAWAFLPAAKDIKE